MADRADMIFELGTEELPPTALKGLATALARGFTAGLDKAGLGHGEAETFATPRRLAVLVRALETQQPDREIERRGPAIKAAFSNDGQPTKAALGFAQSCGVTVDALQRLETPKGEWLAYRVRQAGRSAAALLPEIAETALGHLPIPKRMRWGTSNAEFVRPVHWLLFLHGADVVPCTLLDAVAGGTTRGHRYHSPDAIPVSDAARYAGVLKEQGQVIARFQERRDLIRAGVQAEAERLNGSAVIDEALLDEVTALVEWPVPISGAFEERFLTVPHEALILTMKKNQKYFHLVGQDGRLLPRFITVSNIRSLDPNTIRAGNERVIRPRLTDAMFFWEQDGKRSLADRVESLKTVVFQKRLGTLHDKSQRVSSLAAEIASRIGGDTDLARRAGLLSRCDLMTEMVYEFPEMQGIMGRYQAHRDREPEELATAMDEFYQPRFSGDALPHTRTGIAIALADRLDTLVGIFGIGQRPTGDKDPFALRRAAIGALRIMVTHALPLSLTALLRSAHEGQRDRVQDDEVVEDVYDFMLERLRGIYLDQEVAPDTFEAVAALRPERPADFDRRLQAVSAFRNLPEAGSLAAANKRIQNILRKAPLIPRGGPRPELLEDTAERALASAVNDARADVEPLLARGDYAATLARLAALQNAVDRFFDQVLVMAEDAALRDNRLALLHQVGELFLRTADISRLQS